ncbi:MAG: hypothetical protein HWE27_04500 [Gammaproteobacteria bacterium]|nr:hypothetical protein [Gammaproteobacteria bacterium]
MTVNRTTIVTGTALVVLSAFLWTVIDSNDSNKKRIESNDLQSTEFTESNLNENYSKKIIDTEKNKEVVEAATSDKNSDDLDDVQDPEDIQQFVKSGNPKKVQAYFARQRSERAKLVLEEMSLQGDDSAWAEDLRSKFSDMQNLFPGFEDLTLSSTDCRDSICALSIRFDTQLNRDHYAALKNLNNVLGMDTFVHHDAGEGLSVIYLAKEGASLPNIKKES